MAVAVVVSMAVDGVAGQGAVAELAGFRAAVRGCFTRRGDALQELADAVLCCGGRVTDLAHLSLEPVFRRGHGALFDAVNAGRVEVARLRWAVAAVPLPGWGDGGIRLAVDVSCWPRPDAVTSAERLWCPAPAGGGAAGQVVAGWPYSVVAVLGPGSSSWAVLLDAVRLGAGDEACGVTAAQVREVFTRLQEAGRWREGDPPVIIFLDAGYNVVRLQWLLADLPVVLVARVRSNQVWHRPAPPKQYGMPGRPARHGLVLRCADRSTQDGAAVQDTDHPRHGRVRVRSWPRLHPKLHRHRGGWEHWPPGQHLPIVEGTVIQVTAGRRPPMWLWCSDPGASPDLVRSAWQGYLRRFDIEHVFRFLKQSLGWDKPMLRDPQAADRWTWLLITCWNQLYLARDLAAAVRLPWQPPLPPGKLTPGRVRAAFPRLHPSLPALTSPPKPTRPGPGRPKGSPNKTRAPRHRTGKTSPKTRRRTKTRAKRTG